MNENSKLILARFDDLRDHVTDRCLRIETQLDNICVNCKNAESFKNKITNQWVHITAIWTVLTTVIVFIFEYLTKR